MNTQYSNQLYEEPSFIHGTAGKKQVIGEPQFVTGEEKHAAQLTPLYADNDITTQKAETHQTGQLHREHQKPPADHVHLTIHTDDPSAIDLEKLIHITPDGQIKVIPEEERRHHIENLQEHSHHEEKRIVTPEEERRHRIEHLQEHSPHKEKLYHSERGSLTSKKAGRRLSDRIRIDEPTETTTVREHEPGSAICQ